MSNVTAEELLLIGQIVGVFGVQGQVKLKAVTDRPDHIRRHIRTVFLGPKFQPYQLGKVTLHKPGMLILSFKEVTTRDAAQDLINQEVYIREAEAAPLEPDEYYLHQLYGLTVVDDQGTVIGEVREVFETGSNEVLVVTRRGQNDALIPMIRDVISKIDIEGKQIIITPLEGLL
jgi:16S rRNA processing protein RimM